MPIVETKINLSDAEKDEIFAHEFCAFTPEGNLALALTLIETVKNGFIQPADLDSLDSYCNLVVNICANANRISGDGGCEDTEPRIEVASILRRLLGVDR